MISQNLLAKQLLDSLSAKLYKSLQHFCQFFRSTKHPIFIAWTKNFQSQKSKYQGTARFSVRALWFSVRNTLFLDFLYCYLNDFTGLKNRQCLDSPQMCLVNSNTKHLKMKHLLDWLKVHFVRLNKN